MKLKIILPIIGIILLFLIMGISTQERFELIQWSCNYDGPQNAVGYEWNIGILYTNNWDCKLMLFGIIPIFDI